LCAARLTRASVPSARRSFSSASLFMIIDLIWHPMEMHFLSAGYSTVNVWFYALQLYVTCCIIRRIAINNFHWNHRQISRSSSGMQPRHRELENAMDLSHTAPVDVNMQSFSIRRHPLWQPFNPQLSASGPGFSCRRGRSLLKIGLDRTVEPGRPTFVTRHRCPRKDVTGMENDCTVIECRECQG